MIERKVRNAHYYNTEYIREEDQTWLLGTQSFQCHHRGDQGTVAVLVCQSSGQRSGLEQQPVSMGANLKATEAIGTGSWAPTEPSGQVLTNAGAVSMNNKALSASVLTIRAVTVRHSGSDHSLP